ncbi:hypothetical protein [Prosthecobacter sp.]|uniref:hypothetical protein n=1 Tax=Prosthecobacter sp. TaxID=1965333 RepID=UPI00378470A1
MRGDIVYRIYGGHAGRAEDCYFGTFRTIDEAKKGIEGLRSSRGREWEDRYHNLGFAIREVVVDVDFQIPDQPKPRDKYVVSASLKPNRPGTWDSTLVRVFKRRPHETERDFVCELERNYSLLQTFEPFRKGGREYALISRNYTQTAVLDLASGMVIAEESEDAPGGGFCPVGFYVPDWWDVNDGSVIPGSPYWDQDYEWPNGEFGFVWGCQWGDDSSWKIQYLDLTRIEEGIIRRDDRFGYVEVATEGYRSASIDAQRSPEDERSKPPSFISIFRNDGKTNVTFAVEMAFDLESGKSKGWKRIERDDC